MLFLRLIANSFEYRSRISLISKSDIRYVGTLASINSDDSTVSLENVRTFGTEGRKGKIEEEVPPSDQVYEYIVFRGTDVKDLRIEEGPAAKENKPPAVPNDPAIVGVSLPFLFHCSAHGHCYDEIFSDVKTYLSEKRKNPMLIISVAFLLIIWPRTLFAKLKPYVE